MAQRWRLADVGILLGVATVYYLAARVGLTFTLGAEQVSVVWPAAGVGLAAVLLLGYRACLAIAAGAALVNYQANEPLLVASAIALGNTGGAALGAYLLRRVVGFRAALDRLSDALGLLVLAASTSTMLSATVGVASLCLGGVQSWAHFGSLWWTWWLGDAIGILVVAPFLLTWLDRGPRFSRPYRPAEAFLLALALCGFSAVAFVFGSERASFDSPLNYLIVPLVIWAGLRFSPRGSAAATLFALGVALGATSRQWGEIVQLPLNEARILLPVYMIMVSSTGLLFAAVAAERRRVERRRDLHHHVTQVLAEASELPPAMHRLLAAVCRELGWAFGAAWMLDETRSRLECVETWYRHDGGSAGFDAATRGSRFERGIGLPGRVWQSHRPLWIADLAGDERFTRCDSATASGLHGALAFPIVVHEQLVGVIEFYSRQIERPDQELIDTLAALGAPIGLFVERLEARQELARQEEELREFLENAAIGIHSVGVDGNIVWANRAVLELLGYAREEYVGRPFREFHARLHVADAMLARLALGNTLCDDEVDLCAKDGSIRHVLVSSSPHPDKARGVLARCFIRDITERNRAEEAARFLASAGVVLSALVDPDSTLNEMAHMAVPTFADWCVVRMVQTDGSLRTVTLHHADPSKCELARAMYDNYPPAPDFPYGAHRILESGRSELVSNISEAWVSLMARDAEHARQLQELGLTSYIGVPLRVQEKVVGVVLFGTAESRRRFHEADRAVAEELARRTSIALDNARLYAELCAADRRKDEFLALLAHELRNPLAPISNALEILKMPGLDADTAAAARDLIDRQVQQLVRLVDDLLDLSRIMQNKIDLRKQRVDLVAVVQRALETATPSIDAGRHALDVSLPDEPVWVDADSVRLVQVLANLLNNAAKYTEPGGQIALECRREADQAVVRVRDTGIGIPDELLAPIFEPFFQADQATDRSQGGMGMGLTLARQLAELHGGHIHAQSEGAGKGSEFVLRLPAIESPATLPSAEPATPAATAQQLQRRRTLVVDDNSDVAQSLAMLLRLKGQEVRVAYDGRSALDAARSEPPEFVFLDIGMPGMDGFEVARRMRSEPDLQSIVLVAMTGWGQEEDRRRTREAGFDFHLVKPPSITEVERVLLESMRGRGELPAGPGGSSGATAATGAIAATGASAATGSVVAGESAGSVRAAGSAEAAGSSGKL